jgi:hypothetical protein
VQDGIVPVVLGLQNGKNEWYGGYDRDFWGFGQGKFWVGAYQVPKNAINEPVTRNKHPPP